MRESFEDVSFGSRGRFYMKQKMMMLGICLLLAVVLGGCSNLPVTVTKTPTMTDEEMIEAAKSTADALLALTQTQYALDNPSPTPTDTATPTPEYTATSTIPAIPPTATEEPRPFYSIKSKSSKVYKIGDPSNPTNTFVPMDTLYVEVCWMNSGTATWKSDYRASVVNQGGAGINPVEVYLGKEVPPDQWACFSFQNYNPEQSLGQHCPTFQLYNELYQPINNGFNSVCWTIQ